MLAGIRASGGVGGGRLKKVDPSLKKDRSAALVPGNVAGPSEGGAPPISTGGDTGLAGALQAALNKRKTRVSQSGKKPSHTRSSNLVLNIPGVVDDEDDDDDWDEPPKPKSKK
jgi:hypothetical protein